MIGCHRARDGAARAYKTDWRSVQSKRGSGRHSSKRATPPERGKVKKRVSATASSGKPRVGSYQVRDYIRCEQLVARFEEAEGQNRFPLPVAHLTSSDYYGCDLLSFDKEEDRDLFQSQGEYPDMNLVARFNSTVSVGGSSSGELIVALR